MLGSVFLALSACSVGEESSNSSVLQQKQLTEDEERYFHYGLDFSGAYDVSGKIPENVQTIQFVMNVYENGENLEKISGPVFSAGIRKEEGLELKELTYGISEFSDNENQTTTFELLIGDYYETAKDAKNVSASTYSSKIRVPFTFSQSFTNVGRVSIKENETSHLAIMTSGNSLSTNWYKEEELQRLVDKDEKVITFGVKWLDESIASP